MTKKLAALLALTMVVVMGCAVATSNSAASSASASGTAYILSTSNNVVVASASHNTEGVTLSATLEEFQMPTVWAAVQTLAVTEKSNATAKYDYYLYNKYVGGYTVGATQTTPNTPTAGAWDTAGGVYYAKYIQIGTKVFTFQAASTTYVAPDGTTLPSVNLTVADRADYAEKMSKGWYSILNTNTPGDYMTGLDYTKTATLTASTDVATLGTVAVTAITGATRSNRWERSFNTAWAAQMNNAVKFVKGRILTSLDADTLLSTDPATVATIVTVKNGIWYVGNDATGVANAPWAFPTYLGAFVTAYNGGNTTSTTSGGVTGGNGTTGGTDATSGATS